MKKATNFYAENQFHSLFDHSPNAIYLFDLEGRFLKVNRVGQDVLGVSEQEVLNKTFEDRIVETDRERARGSFRLTCAGETLTETLCVVRQGEIVDLHVTQSPVWFDGNVTSVLVIAEDITEKKREEALIHHMAYYDPLTDLPNRVLFRQRLLDTLQNTEAHAAVLFLDLDQFKIVNDTLGHSAGDEVLKTISKRITGCLSEEDTLSRFSGDEFVVLLPDIANLDRVQQVAGDIIEVMKEPFALNGYLFYMTCSIGIVFAPEHGEDPESLMQNADTAMYIAKEQGKNMYAFFHPHMSRRMSRRIELESAMRKAIEDEEFSLCYQPQVDASTGRVYGAEALIRWTTPERTLSPAEFIPLAEETGLIVELGAWVLRSACLQTRAWREQDLPPIRVSVNLSSRQFQDPHFLQKVNAILQETGVDPRWIGLEITESLIMGNVAYATQTLRELRKMGFEISIDDFGTGYSSLAYLKTFPIHKLKIDQQFVRDVTTNQEDKAITKAIIALAKILGLQVVAEGVETEEHVRLLSEEGCDELQGYFFSKPIPAQEFEHYLRAAM